MIIRMHSLIIFTAIAILSSIAIPTESIAQDQRVQHACPPVGTTTKTTTGIESVVVDVSGLTCTLKIGNDRIAYLHAGFAFLGTPFGDALAPKIEKLWPLEVGKEISYQWTPAGSRSDGMVTYQVIEKKRITVPAGTYDTFVVVQNVSFVGSYHGVHTIYYAPEAAIPVKVDFVAKQGTPATPQSSWELVAYQRP